MFSATKVIGKPDGSKEERRQPFTSITYRHILFQSSWHLARQSILTSFLSPSRPTSETYVSTTTFWKVASADICSLKNLTSEEFLNGNTVWWKLPKGLQIG